VSIIENSTVRMPEVVNCRRERPLVSRAQGAVSLTVKEVELHPGWEGRLHTHPTDVAIMVTGGAVQMVLDGEIRTVRAGFTMVAPPGTPHKLVNQLWIPARMLVIYPAEELQTTFLE
jgi:quercetin dioxygenase-like cupin family protein